MNSASTKTYISKKQISAFKEMKEKLKNKTAEEAKVSDPQNQIPEDLDEEYDRRSIENVDSDELDGDINLSDDEDAAQIFRTQNR